MNDKSTLLASVSEALKNGVLTENDLRKLLKKTPMAKAEKPGELPRLSAVDVMFYIAGIVLFAAILALIGQVWDGGPTARIVLSAGTGIVFWTAAYLLITSSGQSDIRRGLMNALLLTGSLSLIAGGFIIANEIVDYSEFNYYATAATLAILGVLHIGFGWTIKRDLLLLIGILLAVGAFPVFATALLKGSGAPLYVYNLIVAVSGGLLAYATRVVAKVDTTKAHIARSLDSLAAFTVLMSLFAASFNDTTGLLWLLALIAGIVGLFYLSIVMQDKLLLGNGSFFLVLAIITTSFRYFSGYGVATSLLISAVGLLATAAIATNINRRYLRA